MIVTAPCRLFIKARTDQGVTPHSAQLRSTFIKARTDQGDQRLAADHPQEFLEIHRVHLDLLFLR